MKTKTGAIVLLLGCIVASTYGKEGHVRYFDHPEIPYKSPPDVVITTEMMEKMISDRRKMSTYVTLEQKFADHAYDDSVIPLRITYDYDFLDTDSQMCRYENQQVTPYLSERGIGGTTYTCTAEDVYQDSWKALMQENADWMAEFLELYIYKTGSSNDFVINTNDLSPWNLNANGYNVSASKSWTYPDTDLVIFMTLHKCATGVAGYASCVHYDEVFGSGSNSGRCLVGQFNWCPSTIDIANKDDPTTKQTDRYLFLHETLHVLGCCSGDYFLDTNGNSVTADITDQQYAPATAGLETFDKTVRFFHSPKVLATAREQWGCESITGVPLEDVPLGAGSHWEARVMGAEVMAYGSSSGESYMSDLTWAYLEDSGHYIVARNYKTGDQFTANNNNYLDNYTYAVGGRLLEATGSGWTQGTISLIAEFFGFASEKEDGEAVVRSPGYLRWGRKRGCDFFPGTSEGYVGKFLHGLHDPERGRLHGRSTNVRDVRP